MMDALGVGQAGLMDKPMSSTALSAYLLDERKMCALEAHDCN